MSPYIHGFIVNIKEREEDFLKRKKGLAITKINMISPINIRNFKFMTPVSNNKQQSVVNMIKIWRSYGH